MSRPHLDPKAGLMRTTSIKLTEKQKRELARRGGGSAVRRWLDTPQPVSKREGPSS